MGDDRYGDLIDADVAARLLGVKRATLYTWRYRGYGPKSYNVGGSVRYRRIDLLSWLELNSDPGDAVDMGSS